MSRPPSSHLPYIIEYIPMGHYIKVSAVDQATGTEVSIVGDPHASERELEDLAIKKLKYVLAKKQA